MSVGFVAYTVRGGEVDAEMLSTLRRNIEWSGSTYVDLLDNAGPFSTDIWSAALNEASTMFVCRSDGWMRSPWLRLELDVARLKGLPLTVVDRSGNALASYSASPGATVVFNDFDAGFRERRVETDCLHDRLEAAPVGPGVKSRTVRSVARHVKRIGHPGKSFFG